jgi:hypothetical protein
VTLRVGAERVARNDQDLVGERAGDLVYDAIQHSKPQRADDGTGTLQRVAVAGGGGRRATDLCSQCSCRLPAGAGEPQDPAA